MKKIISLILFTASLIFVAGLIYGVTSDPLNAALIYPGSSDYINSDLYLQTPVTTSVDSGVAASPSETTGVKSLLQTQVRTIAPTPSLTPIGSGTKVEPLFNPKEYQLDKTVQWENSKAHGDAPAPTWASSSLKSFAPRLSTSDIIQKVDVRGWDPQKKESINLDRASVGGGGVAPRAVGGGGTTPRTNITPESVGNTDDLKNFAVEIMTDDQNIKKVHLSAGDTNIDYDVPAKLFGIFSIHTTMHVSVSGNKVKVQLPWYRFLFKKSMDLNENTLNNQLSAELEMLKLQSEIQQQAEAFQTITNILKARHDASQQAISNIK